MKVKNSFIRRAIALAMCGVMAFSLTACSNDRGSSEDSSISNPITEPSSGTPVEPEQTILDSINEAFQVNNDVVGWLTVPGTEIDEPVVQGDNNVEYERAAWTDAAPNGQKKYDFYGCYFADAGNTFGNRNDLSRNTIIYGHNMHNVTSGPKDTLKFGALFKLVDFNNDGTIFGDDVASASDFSFAQQHPVLYFSTTDDEMVWVIYAAYFTDLGFQYHLENPDDATFTAMIKEAKDRSRLDYDVDVNTSDRILTLSTCAYKYTDSVEKRDLRFVVQARLLRPGEEIPTSAKVSRNTDVKEPAQHATSTIAG